MARRTQENESQKRELEKRRELDEKKAQLNAFVSQLAFMEECLSFEPTSIDPAGQMKDCLSFMERVRPIENEDVKKEYYRLQKELASNKETPMEAIHRLKVQIELAKRFPHGRIDPLKDEITSLEEEVNNLYLANKTLDFSKASVDLTNINIKVAIWVPVIILVFTVIATIAFETFKPEITHWIRHLFGLPTAPKIV